jgi:hypothetical protein
VSILSSPRKLANSLFNAIDSSSFDSFGSSSSSSKARFSREEDQYLSGSSVETGAALHTLNWIGVDGFEVPYDAGPLSETTNIWSQEDIDIGLSSCSRVAAQTSSPAWPPVQTSNHNTNRNEFTYPGQVAEHGKFGGQQVDICSTWDELECRNAQADGQLRWDMVVEQVAELEWRGIIGHIRQALPKVYNVVERPLSQESSFGIYNPQTFSSVQTFQQSVQTRASDPRVGPFPCHLCPNLPPFTRRCELK